jgi:hypothetical protein
VYKKMHKMIPRERLVPDILDQTKGKRVNGENVAEVGTASKTTTEE